MANIEVFVTQIMELVVNHYSGALTTILTGVISGLIIWRMQLRDKDKKSQVHQNEQMLDLRKEVIREIDYNITSGVGNAKCPFTLDVISKLVHQKSLDSEIANLASEIVTAAKLCNAYGGRRHLDKPPGVVKELQKRLKDLLQ